MIVFDKDSWILRAIKARYILPQGNGEIYRLGSDGFYNRVNYQIHKKSGRVYFNMTFEKITKSVLVNRVIALHFQPNPKNLPQVNHIDGNKGNNQNNNLEWATRRDNEKHAHATGLKSGRGSQNANVRLTANQVVEIRSSEKTIAEMTKKYGVSRSTINNVLNRVTWVHL
ncbi:MAG: HNH endonuclease [Undibacterium sp.]